MKSPSEEHILEPDEAARLIFNTSDPNPEQVAKVEGEIKRGALRPSRKGAKTTTAEAVADYFAARAAADLAAHVPYPQKSTPKSTPNPAPKEAKASTPGEESEVTGVYQTLLKDYFLGIFLQRQSKQYPDFFQRAVLGGQIALVLAMFAVLFWAFSSATGMFSLGKSPQRIAVEKKISEMHGSFEIETVSPGSDEHDLVVKYRYRAPSGKQIQTQRVFRVDDGNVSIVESE